MNLLLRVTHRKVRESGCDESNGWHDYGPWSAPYPVYHTTVATENGTVALVGQWRERRCRINGCYAGQWEPVVDVLDG